MIFSLKKAMEYGPKSQEVQHILEQIFNYYGIVSNKSTFTLDDVLLIVVDLINYQNTDLLACL